MAVGRLAAWLVTSVCTAWLLAVPATSAQRADFRTHVDVVRLDALVTERGAPLLGLSADDFEVVDNGTRQTIDHVSLDVLPVNVVETIDMSESVSGAVQQQLQLASAAVSQGLRLGDQAALITFNHRVTLGLALTGDVRQLAPAVAAVAPQGGTSLRDAVYTSLWMAERDPGRAVVIVFSDGRDTASWLSSERVLEASQRVDATIYAVTSGRQRDPFLADLAAQSGGRVFDAGSRRITEAFTDILAEFRQRYVISYTPRGVSATGWHKVELRVRGHRATIKVRDGYLAGPK